MNGSKVRVADLDLPDDITLAQAPRRRPAEPPGSARTAPSCQRHAFSVTGGRYRTIPRFGRCPC